MCFDDREHSNLFNMFVQSVLSSPLVLVHKVGYKTSREHRESTQTFVVFGKLTGMMNLIRNQGAVLSVLLSLLVSQISCQDPDRDVAYLKVRLALLKDHYKLMCKHYSSLAQNCSAPDFPAIRCTECPDGWLQVEDQCFHLSTDRQDQAASADECKKMDARLAILTTREQHDAVEKEGRRIGGLYTNYWIGLSDIENEGEWKWVDDSKLTVPFWNVEKAEPDNNVSGGPNGEDCVVVDSYTRTWYDVPCDFAYPRICQKAANPLP